MAPQDWARTLDLMKQYQDVATELAPTAFYTNQLVEK
jgi:NitT/TauT family transport system substrate-binding protein